MTEEAVKALGKIGDTKAVDALIATLKKEAFFSSLQKAAAYALVKIGDTRSIDALNETLKEGNSQQREYATIALGYAVDFDSVRCSKCKKELVHLGEPTFSPFTSVLGSPSSIQAMDQWRGNVCIKCQLIFCPDCIEIGYPTPCPKCGTPTKPAQKGYLENLTKLGKYNEN